MHNLPQGIFLFIAWLIVIVYLHDAMAFPSSVHLFKAFDLSLHAMNLLGSKYIEVYTVQWSLRSSNEMWHYPPVLHKCTANHQLLFSAFASLPPVFWPSLSCSNFVSILWCSSSKVVCRLENNLNTLDSNNRWCIWSVTSGLSFL